MVLVAVVAAFLALAARIYVSEPQRGEFGKNVRQDDVGPIQSAKLPLLRCPIMSALFTLDKHRNARGARQCLSKTRMS